MGPTIFVCAVAHSNGSTRVRVGVRVRVKVRVRVMVRVRVRVRVRVMVRVRVRDKANVARHAQSKCPLGSAPARLLRLLRARLAALGDSALSGRGLLTARQATCLGCSS